MERLVLGVVGATIIALVISGTASANSVLRNDARVDGELFAVAVGDRIRRNCDSISPRMGVVWSRARALDKYAKSLGFSRADIDAYMDNKADQERFKTRAKAYLAERGASSANKDGYCKVGRDEIAAKSAIGTLLRGR